MQDRKNLSIRQLADVGCRQNLYLFLVGAFEVLHPGKKLMPAPYLEAMCFALQEVINGRSPRLMISIAPRHLKSVCGSVLFPAFLLGHRPETKVMVVSYGGELAREQAVLFRRLIASRFYQRLFPSMRIDPRHTRVDHLKTTRGGSRHAVSLGGSVTGFGADVIVIDDLAKASDVQSETIREQARLFFDESLFSRLDNKRDARIVSIQQRLHEDDFAAYLLEKGTFHHLCLPSIAERRTEYALFGGRIWIRELGDILSPEREPKAVLEQIRKEIGAYAFRAQYQQDPAPGLGEFLSMDDLHLVDEIPDPERIVRYVQSWDTAVKDGPRCDYSAGLTFGWHDGEERWYLMDVIRERLKFPELLDRIRAARRQWRSDRVLIESSNLGIGALDVLRKEVSGVFLPVIPTDGKVDRFVRQTDWIRSGQLVIPTNMPWFDAFRRELLQFPKSAHDDQVDALTQFAAHMRRKQGTYLDTVPETGQRLGNYRPSRPRREDRMQF
ncbi:phage terminase large subunit [Sedimentimonas flavescens]|uniref:Phage terminase large subunit n=1 Tax=Sedimentimonas flavescens TaxID=2851012 RepID=A0ABT3A302_9RHOB|nr:phage terminase large subunit [Sedimentimonas flavescens]MCV2880388.1 phage terminase large subunit [Sedimentimonas flavescens]